MERARNRATDAMGHYLGDIGAVPRLTEDEVLDLARRARAGDPAARARLVAANLRLVVRVARRYANGDQTDLLDLVQEGSLGLLRAAELYDPERGFAFSTYAMWWVRQACARGACGLRGTIRIPQGVEQGRARLRRARACMEAEGLDPGDEEELCRRAGLRPGAVAALDLVVAQPVRLGEGDPGGVPARGAEQGREGPRAGAWEEEEGSPHAQACRGETARGVHALLRTLPPIHRRVLEIRYGMGGRVPLGPVHAGATLGMGRDEIRRVEREALGMLRLRQESEGLAWASA